jgi:predicted ArsR family transcriptional regulator
LHFASRNFSKLAMADEPKTRRSILDRLKQDGPQAAGSLAEALGLSPMAIRLHLYELRDQGLVESENEPRPIGRPVKLWRLTAGADAFFPDGHADLATELIDGMRAVFGEDGLERIVTLRAGRQIESYRAALADTPDLAARVQALAARRSAEGYMAEAVPDADGWLLVENHCPICAAARACAGFCRSELAVFRAALGPDASIERVDHILAGARRCAYRIRPC